MHVLEREGTHFTRIPHAETSLQRCHSIFKDVPKELQVQRTSQKWLHHPADLTEEALLLKGPQGSNIIVVPTVICFMCQLDATASCRARLFTFSLKNPYLPPEVLRLFGGLTPSTGHANRLCRILRSEAWQQIPFYTERFPSANLKQAPKDRGEVLSSGSSLSATSS